VEVLLDARELNKISPLNFDQIFMLFPSPGVTGELAEIGLRHLKPNGKFVLIPDTDLDPRILERLPRYVRQRVDMDIDFEAKSLTRRQLNENYGIHANSTPLLNPEYIPSRRVLVLEMTKPT
jgi:hypothetical protein